MLAGSDFRSKAGVKFDEDAINGNHELVVVASIVDFRTERIVHNLTDLGVPLSLLSFGVFVHGETQVLSLSTRSCGGHPRRLYRVVSSLCCLLGPIAILTSVFVAQRYDKAISAKPATLDFMIAAKASNDWIEGNVLFGALTASGREDASLGLVHPTERSQIEGPAKVAPYWNLFELVAIAIEQARHRRKPKSSFSERGSSRRRSGPIPTLWRSATRTTTRARTSTLRNSPHTGRESPLESISERIRAGTKSGLSSFRSNPAVPSGDKCGGRFHISDDGAF